MLNKVYRYYHTIRHLKFIQVRYQLWYRLRKKIFPLNYKRPDSVPEFQKITLEPFPNQHTHYSRSNTFRFLNIEHSFQKVIDWNIMEYGKLWCYHLNYFDYLHQKNLEERIGFHLIDSFLQIPEQRKEGLEPYPISLRTINWIKFLSKTDTYPDNIVSHLYEQYKILIHNIEYHLLANHLLENGFSILFGAVFFQDKKLNSLAKEIMIEQLEEQILKDGAHYELSPMYHLIILQRSLDAYNLLSNNIHSLYEVKDKLETVIPKMLGWLKSMQFSNGELPNVNDSVEGQSLSSSEIIDYAKTLGFKINKSILSESGYRKLSNNNIELICDVGHIGPNYQPGHAHSDTLSFILYYNGKPYIVDRGISTYEKNKIRAEQRKTASHNTVVVMNEEQSDVWGGFRVGKRASCFIEVDKPLKLKANHDGFKNIGVSHSRDWSLKNNSIVITDELIGSQNEAKAYLHFHPDIVLTLMDSNKLQANDLIIEFESVQLLKLKTSEYDYCLGFNKVIKASLLVIIFKKELKTVIYQ